MPFAHASPAASASATFGSIPSPATTAATGSWRPDPVVTESAIGLRRDRLHRVAGEQLDAARAVRVGDEA